MWIHLRLTVSQDFILGFTDWLRLTVVKYLIVFETSVEGVEHYHCHFLFVNDSKSPMEAFRKKLVAQFPFLIGNKQYSLAITNDEYKHDCYICKGDNLETLPVVTGKSALKYKDEYIEDCHKAYWSNRKEYLTISKKKTFVSAIADECKDIDTTKSILIIRKEIFATTLKMLGKNGKSLDEIILRRLVNGVMNMIIPHQFAAYIYDRTFDNSERIDR